jgi:hypothetical protein
MGPVGAKAPLNLLKVITAFSGISVVGEIVRVIVLFAHGQ